MRMGAWIAYVGNLALNGSAADLQLKFGMIVRERVAVGAVLNVLIEIK